jgi:hypothetical protein
MNNKYESSIEEFGLLANGSSARRDIAVDEALDRDEWSMEIEGPRTYLVFQLQDQDVLPKALQFLQAGPGTNRACDGHGNQDNGASLTLGQFDSVAVSLVWDNEDVPRCFIVIGPQARSTLRVALEADDVRMVIEALDQVVRDLPEAARD